MHHFLYAYLSKYFALPIGLGLPILISITMALFLYSISHDVLL